MNKFEQAIAEAKARNAEAKEHGNDMRNDRSMETLIWCRTADIMRLEKKIKPAEAQRLAEKLGREGKLQYGREYVPTHVLARQEAEDAGQEPTA